jgi:hypothetical protein
MTMLVPLVYLGKTRIVEVGSYDNYCMMWEYFKSQYQMKKSGRRIWYWQIASGNEPMARVVSSMGFVT